MAGIAAKMPGLQVKHINTASVGAYPQAVIAIGAYSGNVVIADTIIITWLVPVAGKTVPVGIIAIKAAYGAYP